MIKQFLASEPKPMPGFIMVVIIVECNVDNRAIAVWCYSLKRVEKGVFKRGVMNHGETEKNTECLRSFVSNRLDEQ